MKNILLILEGDVAKTLLYRLTEANITHSHYDVIYSNDALLNNISKKNNFLFYKFDATSYSKLSLLLNKKKYYTILVINSNKFDTIEIVKNIKQILPNINTIVYNIWNLQFNYKFLQNFNALEELSNALIQLLPNIPVFAQNVGLKKGEILEVAIPYSSFYAYKYIGSISQKKFKIAALYRNEKLILPKPTTIIKPNDILLLIGNPKILIQLYNQITQVLGHFPLPYGKNIYLFLDLKRFDKTKTINLVKKAINLQKRLKSSYLVIKIINPSTIKLLKEIELLSKDIEKSCVCEISYDINLDFEVIKQDIIRFEVGCLVIDKNDLKRKDIFELISSLKIPIFKVNSQFEFLKYTNISVSISDFKSYEQIIPTIFDIAMQFKFKVNFIDSNPYGEHNKDLKEYINNLETVFNIEVDFIKNNNNPVRELLKKDYAIQIMPLLKDINKSSFFSKFLTNSDMISYHKNRFDQFLIPIVKSEDEV